MASRHVVVDGSNVATEGRSMPSLAQLDQAVREFMTENPDDVVTVVVDASFGHRIDPSEVSTYEEADAAGELVSPPAGAIGRGDAFLLRIADKTGATVLSNDSFQEFHGEHVWLFEKGRLIGGKPVPGVGWIFTPRTPVRGPRSREAVKEAKRTKRGDVEVPATVTGLDLAAERARGKGKGKKTVERAIAVATEEAVEPKVAKRRRRRTKGGAPPAEAVNEPLTFITFIAAHPLGTEVEGTVEAFASHGAFVTVDGARCYLPLSAMGDPPPRSGREVFARGDTRRFVIQALDPQRRGVELALPGFVRVAGTPTDETVEAEIAGAPVEEAAPVGSVRRRGRRVTTPAGGSPAATGESPGVPVGTGQRPASEPALAGARGSRRPRKAGSDAAPVGAPAGSAPAKRAGADGARPDRVAAKRAAGPEGAVRAKGPSKKAPAPGPAAAPARATKGPAKAAPAKASAKAAPAKASAQAKKAPAQAKKAPAQARAAKAPARAAKALAKKAPAKAGAHVRPEPGVTPTRTEAGKKEAATKVAPKKAPPKAAAVQAPAAKADAAPAKAAKGPGRSKSAAAKAPAKGPAARTPVTGTKAAKAAANAPAGGAPGAARAKAAKAPVARVPAVKAGEVGTAGTTKARPPVDRGAEARPRKEASRLEGATAKKATTKKAPATQAAANRAAAADKSGSRKRAGATSRPDR